MTIWDELLIEANQRLNEAPADAATLRAIWNTHYATRLTSRSSTLDLRFIACTTTEIGCAYYEPPTRAPHSLARLVGRHVLWDQMPRLVRMAGVDALFGSL